MRGVRSAMIFTMLAGAGGFVWASKSLFDNPPPVWEKHVVPHGPLVPLASNLWQVTGQIEPRSDAMMRNMVIYRLPPADDGANADDRSHAPTGTAEQKEKSTDELLLHSVIALTEEGMEQLESLGRVKYILVPSRFHRLDADVYKKRYPNAQVICPKDIQKPVEKIVPVDATVEDVFALPSYSKAGLKCHLPGAGLYIHELVYELPLEEEAAMDNQKKALVCNDLLVNVADGPFNVRMLGIVTGGNQPKVPWAARHFFVRDKKQMRSFWETMAKRDDIGLLLMAHGEPVIENTTEALCRIASQF